MRRLSVSLGLSATSTPQEAADAISGAIETYARLHRQNPGEPWRDDREHRGLISISNTAAGAWRVVTERTKPEEIADEIIERMGRTAPAMPNIRAMISEAIREDRRLASRIIPDEDF